MELDQLKSTWNQLHGRGLNTGNINLQKMNTMQGTLFYSRFYKILVPELTGALVSLASAAYLVARFYKLSSPFLQVNGIITIVLLVVLPAIGLSSVWQLYKGNKIGVPYAEAVREFAVQKMRFCKLQKLNIFLSYLLLVTMILIIPSLFGKNNTTGSKYFFVFAFTIGYSFLVAFSSWVFKSYKKTIRQAEELLNDLAA
jgi:hypothetical protein